MSTKDKTNDDPTEGLEGNIQRTLPDLARRINVEHEACLDAARSAIGRAIEVGRLLVEAKDQVRHGEWAGWVVEHCTFGVRQAQRYMHVFKNRETIEEEMRHGVTHLDSLRDAIKALPVVQKELPPTIDEPSSWQSFRRDAGNWQVAEYTGGYGFVLRGELDGDDVYLAGWVGDFCWHPPDFHKWFWRLVKDEEQAAHFDDREDAQQYMKYWLIDKATEPKGYKPFWTEPVVVEEEVASEEVLS